MTDIINTKIDFYCLNFQNENSRRQRMNKKSIYFKIPIQYYSGVTKIDPRISFIEDEKTSRCASICYGHLDIINHFVKNSRKEFIVIMEDDIIIRKTFCEDIIKALDIFIKYEYDILLLGYLMPYKLENEHFKLKENSYSYLNSVALVTSKFQQYQKIFLVYFHK